jgi:hypothetical protein
MTKKSAGSVSQRKSDDARKFNQVLASYVPRTTDHKATLDAHREGIKFLLTEDYRSISYILLRLQVSGTAPQIKLSTLQRYIRDDKELSQIIEQQIKDGLRADYRRRKMAN